MTGLVSGKSHCGKKLLVRRQQRPKKHDTAKETGSFCHSQKHAVAPSVAVCILTIRLAAKTSDQLKTGAWKTMNKLNRTIAEHTKSKSRNEYVVVFDHLGT
jgi:ADP-ribosylglycohydrolase